MSFILVEVSNNHQIKMINCHLILEAEVIAGDLLAELGYLDGGLVSC